MYLSISTHVLGPMSGILILLGLLGKYVAAHLIGISQPNWMHVHLCVFFRINAFSLVTSILYDAKTNWQFKVALH